MRLHVVIIRTPGAEGFTGDPLSRPVAIAGTRSIRSIPAATGRDRGRDAPLGSAQSGSDVAAVDGGDIGGRFERHRMMQEGLRNVLGPDLAAEQIA